MGAAHALLLLVVITGGQLLKDEGAARAVVDADFLDNCLLDLGGRGDLRRHLRCRFRLRWVAFIEQRHVREATQESCNDRHQQREPSRVLDVI